MPLRAVFATTLVALALYGLSRHALLASGVDAGPWGLGLLALALLVAGIACVRVRPAAGDGAPGSMTRASRLQVFGAILVCTLVTTAVLLPIGVALLHGPREWDGRVAWELRATQLAVSGFFQPFFLDIGVYAPAREYPLLQPLIVGDVARVLGMVAARFTAPLFFLLLVLGLFVTLRRVVTLRVAALAALAYFVLPGWIGPGAGSLDSGYGDLLVALLLLAAGASCLRKAAESGRPSLEDLLFWSVLVTLPMVKPEGLVYAYLVLAVALRSTRRWVFVVGSALCAASCLLVLGVRSWSLPLRGSAYVAACLLPACLVAVRYAIDGVARMEQRFGRPLRWTGIAVLVCLACGALWWSVVGVSMEVLGEASLARLGSHIAHVPMTALGAASVALDLRKFGLAWVCLGLGVVLWRLAPQRYREITGLRELGLFVAGGLLLAFASLFLVPETELHHELVSRFDRLLLQWSAPAWLLAVLTSFGADCRADGCAARPADGLSRGASVGRRS